MATEILHRVGITTNNILCCLSVYTDLHMEEFSASMAISFHGVGCQ